MIEETKKIVTDTIKNAEEIIRERLFSPMYFYFIIAWSISNWKFIYALLFIKSSSLRIPKIEYLCSLYPETETFNNVFHLFIIPIISTYLVVWILSGISEKIFAKNEEHKINIRLIKKRFEYKEKVEYSNIQREIRNSESDKRTLYEMNSDFNRNFDEINDNIEIAGGVFLASETLFNTDIDLYKESLNEYKNEKI